MMTDGLFNICSIFTFWLQQGRMLVVKAAQAFRKGVCYEHL